MIILSVVKQAIKNIFNDRVESWLTKRVPSRFKHTLSNRNIFILPTRFGLTYLFFDVLLFLLGTNYQNNVILLLSYLLASLFITVMLHSFYNFSQLTFSSNVKQTCFANQVINFPINVTGHKTHFDINLKFVNPQYYVKDVKLTQCAKQTSEVFLPWYAKQRGIYTLGRVKVFSEYSMGLFITWSLLDFSHQAIVFPEPKRLADDQRLLSNPNEVDANNTIYTQLKTDGYDYSELKNYIPGEAQARIAWKQLARGQGKFSKHYQAQCEQGGLLWLKLSQMPSSDLEEKLQYLCFMVIEYTKNKQSFGLVLDLILNNKKGNEIKIEPNSGHDHQEVCLMALANVNNRQ
jgi:uncharacterized protein (DUF58 family)